MQPEVTAFFHQASKTVSYVAADPVNKIAAVIDPVLDFEIKAARTTTTAADDIVAFINARGYRLDWILETHAHADHLTSATYLQNCLGGRIAIGAEIGRTQQHFGQLFNLDDVADGDGSLFDQLFADGDAFAIGKIVATVMHTPGHTPACVTYVIGDAAFVGDTLFMPDYGTARCDFPGGDAAALYRSIRRILDLPPETRLFTCHDYQPGGRAVAWEASVAQQRQSNIHIHEGVTESDFVTMRQTRDRTLSVPDLLLPAVQVNIRAGRLPKPEANGQRYLKLPLNAL
jgi:glyoxylase-like metal-dependent hydrolase (beta-lactamase superfamily II)